MWDLTSLTRVQTSVPCIGRQILNYWLIREVLEELNLTEVLGLKGESLGKPLTEWKSKMWLIGRC